MLRISIAIDQDKLEVMEGQTKREALQDIVKGVIKEVTKGYTKYGTCYNAFDRDCGTWNALEHTEIDWDEEGEEG